MVVTPAAKAAWPGEVHLSAGTSVMMSLANRCIGSTISCWGLAKAGWPRAAVIYLLSGGGSNRDFGTWKKIHALFLRTETKLLNFSFQSLLKNGDRGAWQG